MDQFIAVPIISVGYYASIENYNVLFYKAKSFARLVEFLKKIF